MRECRSKQGAMRSHFDAEPQRVTGSIVHIVTSSFDSFCLINFQVARLAVAASKRRCARKKLQIGSSDCRPVLTSWTLSSCREPVVLEPQNVLRRHNHVCCWTPGHSGRLVHR